MIEMGILDPTKVDASGSAETPASVAGPAAHDRSHGRRVAEGRRACTWRPRAAAWGGMGGMDM